jgi:tape measure domain-containing protein
MARIITQLIIQAKNTARAAFDQLNGQLDGLNKKLGFAGKAMAGVFSAALFTGAVRSIANTADAYNLMNARLKLATGSQQEFNVATSELTRIARDNQTPVSALVSLYGRLSLPLKEAGRSQADIIKVIDAVSSSLRVSGATFAESESSILQFSQAMASGVLRGDEFNSIAEASPRLMRAMADGMNVPIGSLRAMAKEGLLTAEVVGGALISQLDVLKAEAETLPQTVGGALTALSDAWDKAIGGTDVQPLIDSIDDLTKTVSDPAVVAGLASLAGALIRIAAAAGQAAAELGEFGKWLGYSAAKISGQLSEIDHAEQEIKMYQNAIDGIGVADLFHSDEDLQKNLALWQEYRTKIINEMTGMSGEMTVVLDLAAAAADDARQTEIDAQTKYLGELKTLQDQQLNAAKKAIKEQEALQKKAIAAKAKIAEDRKAIDEKYNETKTKLNGAGGKADTYGAAQDLKLSARSALQSGNSAAAIKQAEAARQALLDLQAAGGSTYGLAGFADELRAIEQAAKDLEATDADSKIAVIGLNIAALIAQAADLKKITVTPIMDDAAAATLTAALQALADSLGRTLTIPVKLVATGFTSDMASLGLELPAIKGFATGGRIRGPGTGTSDSILIRASNGEFMMRAAAVRAYGPALLEKMNGLRLPKFAEGGMIGAAMSAPVGQTGRDLGRVELNIGGQTHSLLADAGSFDQLRMASLKFGRTHKN